MKNLKNYLMLFACLLVASMTLTSCMNDDDNTENYKVLTQAEKSQVMMALSGTYTGKMKYYSNSTYNSADSVSTSWRITSDSTFVMQFPMEAVEGFIDGQDNKSDIGNGRGVRNIFEKTITEQAKRTELNKEADIATITMEDIQAAFERE